MIPLIERYRDRLPFAARGHGDRHRLFGRCLARSAPGGEAKDMIAGMHYE